MLAPSDWPTDEELDRICARTGQSRRQVIFDITDCDAERWEQCREVDAAQYNPRQEEYK